MLSNQCFIATKVLERTEINRGTKWSRLKLILMHILSSKLLSTALEHWYSTGIIYLELVHEKCATETLTLEVTACHYRGEQQNNNFCIVSFVMVLSKVSKLRLIYIDFPHFFAYVHIARVNRGLETVVSVLFTNNALAECTMNEKNFISRTPTSLLSLFTSKNCNAPLCFSFRPFRNRFVFHLVKFVFISSTFTKFIAILNE